MRALSYKFLFFAIRTACHEIRVSFVPIFRQRLSVFATQFVPKLIFFSIPTATVKTRTATRVFLEHAIFSTNTIAQGWVLDYHIIKLAAWGSFAQRKPGKNNGKCHEHSYSIGSLTLYCIWWFLNTCERGPLPVLVPPLLIPRPSAYMLILMLIHVG